MKKFIAWIRPSFEDNTGKASYRRITAFVFVWLMCYMVVCDKIKSDIHLKVFYAIEVGLMLMTGIVTTQNILTYFNKPSKTKDDVPKED